MDTAIMTEEQISAEIGEFTPKITTKWDIVAGIAIIHLAALAAPWCFTWKGFWVFLGFQAVTGIGITLAFHRLLTHRSFKTPKWLEYVLTVCGSLAMQGGPIKWVATHRVHHAYSDRPQDPHSPNRGFMWAHIMWLFAYDAVLDHPIKHLRYASDLANDPVHRFIERTYVLQTVLLGALLYAWGGLSAVIWGVFLRTVFGYHGTWLVNSAAHIWGYQTYQTNEGSRNNWWVALVSYGEGWHNNHHAYPSSAAHGLRWWEFDITYLTIRFLWLLGLAKDIRLPRGNPAQLPVASPTWPKRLRLPIPEPAQAVA